MKSCVYLCLAMALFAGAAFAQPAITPNGIVNAASSAPVGLPNSSIAQGSMFSIYGQRMGPSQSPALSFPLLAEEGLGGVTVAIQPEGGATVFAILLYVSPGQINAILPSAVPPGRATATVAYNGATSAAAQFTVIRSSVGLLTWNQAGSGPGIVQNYHNGTPAFNSITESAIPGDTAVLWGTGLGPVTFNERVQPIQTDLGMGAEVWVGGQRVTNVPYQGRSTSSGQDQINFVVPNTQGCYVPVFVKVGNVVSNTVSMAISNQGGMCSDSVSFSGLDPNRLRTSGLKQGQVTLIRTASRTTAGPFSFDSKFDAASAVFYSYNWSQLTQVRGSNGVSTFGACSVITFTGQNSPVGDLIPPTPLDAGPSLTVTGGTAGTQSLLKQSPGLYAWTNSPVAPDYYNPGAYTVTGPGGPNVGAFTATITLPAPLTWTNADAITSVNRPNGVTVNWTGGSRYVIISGFSVTKTPQTVGAMFTCIEQASRGTFTVSANVLSALPPTADADVPLGFLSVANILNPVPFTADRGLDQGSISGSFTTTRNVTYM